MEPIKAWEIIKEIMDFFLEEKQCLTKLLTNIDINEIKDMYGNTLLHVAASMGDVELVELLLENGANPNAKNEYGETPLHRATNAEVAKKLIRYGSYVNEKDRDGRTPLHYAAYHGRIDVVETLLENDALIITDKDGQTPLHLALLEKRTQVAKLLLKYGADPNVKNKNGETPLHLAVRTGDAELIKMMIERGADVNAVDLDRR